MIGMTEFLDFWGEDITILAIGLITGLLFGIFAQRSKFCFRSAVLEMSHGFAGKKTAVWLLAFGATLAGTQGLILSGMLDVAEVRQLASRGSLSGAIIGGAMFGAGMVMARGCASRILILSANGNLRMLVTGLVLTIVAQASYSGLLSPLREYIADMWTVSGGAERDLSAILGLSGYTPFVIGVAILVAAISLAIHVKMRGWVVFGAIGVGVAITLGWALTYALSHLSFDPVAVRSVNFIGPSADTLMGFITERSLPITFNLALVPGVFAGSLLAAAFGRELKLECFSVENRPMPRYIVGAVLMGFGGMLAGGCAVGSAVSGSSVFALTGWVAMVSMGL
ncbi:MAG: YeeE/YedE family protein, partial [Rhodospirillaceae bacterium]|nr:YeeE/YedE family protein [Rhodospirillaceae bacterium]